VRAKIALGDRIWRGVGRSVFLRRNILGPCSGTTRTRALRFRGPCAVQLQRKAAPVLAQKREEAAAQVEEDDGKGGRRAGDEEDWQ
jgi:hypothetical protein